MSANRWWDDWEDRVDGPAETRSRLDADIESDIEEVVDFAREMVECAIARLRDLMAGVPPPFGAGPHPPQSPGAPFDSADER